MQVYPALRRVGIKSTPLKKMTAGFFLSAAAVAWAAVVQHYIYKVGANVAHLKNEKWILIRADKPLWALRRDMSRCFWETTHIPSQCLAPKRLVSQ